MDQFCIEVVFLYYFFTLQPYVRKPSCSLLLFFVQNLQINKNTDLHSLGMQPSFLTFIFQQSLELLQCNWRIGVPSHHSPAPKAPFPASLLWHSHWTRKAAFFSPREISCQACSQGNLVLHGCHNWGMAGSAVRSHSIKSYHPCQIRLHSPERWQPLSLRGYSHN